eukprot:3118475-Rhodomonas_salina.3
MSHAGSERVSEQAWARGLQDGRERDGSHSSSVFYCEIKRNQPRFTNCTEKVFDFAGVQRPGDADAWR